MFVGRGKRLLGENPKVGFAPNKAEAVLLTCHLWSTASVFVGTIIVAYHTPG